MHPAKCSTRSCSMPTSTHPWPTACATQFLLKSAWPSDPSTNHHHPPTTAHIQGLLMNPADLPREVTSTPPLAADALLAAVREVAQGPLQQQAEAIDKGS